MSDHQSSNSSAEVKSAHLNQKRSERLDKVAVKIWPDWTRTQIQQAIKQGHLLVNEVVQKNPSYKIEEGDRLYLSSEKAHASQDTLRSSQIVAVKLDIVFEDEEILVINKKAGMVVHPGAGQEKDTLVHGVIAHCGNDLPSDDQKDRPGIVHRLDKGTTGLIVVAKEKLSYESLKEQFQNRSIKRSYEAIVRGSLQPDKGVFDDSIQRHPRYRKKMTISETGKKAITHWEVLERLPWATWLKANLETGRTHQIRVHLSAHGYPLVGDVLYSRKKKAPKKLQGKAAELWDSFERPALHARSLGFFHPRKKKDLFFEVDPPKDFKELLNALRDDAALLSR